MGSIAGKVEAAPSGDGTRNRNSRLIRAHFRLFPVAVLAILFLSLGLDYCFQVLRVASVLRFRQSKSRTIAAYDRLFNHAVLIQTTSIPGTIAPVNVVVYTPSGVPNPAPIILVHGFATDGNRDPYLNDVAKRMAPMGFLVVVPTIPGESAFKMQTSDLVVIRNTIRWVAKKTGQEVSVLGVSFGAGLVVPAAADPSVIQDVKLIICLSGFNDLESIGRYFIHDPVFDPRGMPYVGNTPGPLLITAPYLDELVDKNDLPDMRLLVNRFFQNGAQPLPPDDPVLSRMSPRKREEYKQLESVQSPEMQERFRRLLSRHKAEFDSLSPSSVLRNLKTPIYILQGASDPVFPSGEGEWMREELKHSPDAHVLITPWISHVFVGAPASRLDHWRTMQFCTSMLSKAAIRKFISQPVVGGRSGDRF